MLPALFIMTLEGGSAELRSFLTSLLGGGGQAASLPGRFTPAERACAIYCIGSSFGVFRPKEIYANLFIFKFY
jgi:hypothetical protein